MTVPTPTGNIIHVLTIGMDSRKQAVFRMAFKMYTVQRYLLVEDAPGAKPDIAVVDMDCVGAQSLWKDLCAQYPGLPAVITTVSPTDDAPAPVVPKPIRMETLFPLLRQTLSGQVAPRKQPAPSLAPAPAVTAAPPVQPAALELPASVVPSAAPTAAELPPPVVAEAKPMVSPKPMAPPKPHFQLQSESIQYFDTKQGVLSALQIIRRERIPSVVSVDGRAAIIGLPGQDSALLLQDIDVIRRACETSSVSVSTRPLTPADSPVPVASQSFTALLWQSSLWTSRGRLMEGFHPETPVRLRHWPNLTRLAATPQAMRIAALWVRFPVNLRLTIRMLNVSPQHVFDFLAASHSIGILDVYEARAELVASPPVLETPPPSAEQKARGGLLSRLLRRVVRL